MDLKYLLHSAVDIIFTRGFGVENLDREGTSGNSKCWCIAVESRELCNVSTSLREKFGPCFTFSAFMVAEVTMSLRSLRRDRTE